MAWTTLSASDVQTRFAGAEYDALKTKALASGLTDLVPKIIGEVVALIRGYVAACATNNLSAGETIPGNLKSTALDIIRWEMLNRLGLKVADDRATAYREALRRLEKVAACAFAVDAPDEPTQDTQSGGGVSLISSRDRLTRRDQMAGL